MLIVADFAILEQYPSQKEMCQTLMRRFKLTLFASSWAYPADAKRRHIFGLFAAISVCGDAQAFWTLRNKRHQDIYAKNQVSLYFTKRWGFNVNIGVMRYSHRGQGSVIV